MLANPALYGALFRLGFRRQFAYLHAALCGWVLRRGLGRLEVAGG